MPTIRISQKHYEILERMAVDATTERKTVITIGQIAGEHLDKTLPKEGEIWKEKKDKKN